jgi:hypothetical protein
MSGLRPDIPKTCCANLGPHCTLPVPARRGTPGVRTVCAAVPRKQTLLTPAPSGRPLAKGAPRQSLRRTEPMAP